MEIKILLAEDHAFLRRGIRDICCDKDILNLCDEDILILDEVTTCSGLMKALRTAPYSHLIMDITLSDGNALNLLPEILKQFCNLKVVICSSQPARLYGERLKMHFGVGYISKAEQEPKTIQQLVDFLKNRDLQGHPLSTIPTPFDKLSPREKEILQYLLQGLSFAQIAKQVNTSASTVRWHKMKILDKTATKNLLELKDLALLYRL